MAVSCRYPLDYCTSIFLVFILVLWCYGFISDLYIYILWFRHNCWVGDCWIMIFMIHTDDWISHDGIWGLCGEMIYKLCFLIGGLGSVYKWNFVEFLIDFRGLESLKIMSLGWASSSHFSNGLWYSKVLRVLGWVSRNWDLFKDMWRLLYVDLRIGAWHYMSKKFRLMRFEPPIFWKAYKHVNF